jgi:ketosteroid isomerase-like protein
MDAVERAEIERACERLVTQYCHFVDHGEAERVAELFSDDGVWASPEFTMDGIDQIRKGFARRQAQTSRASRHVCNNLLVDVVDGDHATGCVYLTLYRHDGEAGRPVSPLDGPLMVGEYRDRFVRTAAGWRIARREIGVSFVRGARDEHQSGGPRP